MKRIPAALVTVLAIVAVVGRPGTRSGFGGRQEHRVHQVGDRPGCQHPDRGRLRPRDLGAHCARPPGPRHLARGEDARRSRPMTSRLSASPPSGRDSINPKVSRVILDFSGPVPEYDIQKTVNGLMVKVTGEAGAAEIAAEPAAGEAKPAEAGKPAPAVPAAAPAVSKTPPAAEVPAPLLQFDGRPHGRLLQERFGPVQRGLRQ